MDAGGNQLTAELDNSKLMVLFGFSWLQVVGI